MFSSISKILHVGKTRFGKELFNEIKTRHFENIFFNVAEHFEHFEHFEYLYLDFGNSIRLDKQDYFLDNEVIICLQILYIHFIMYKYDLNFEIGITFLAKKSC
jgi:hypothetical protein